MIKATNETVSEIPTYFRLIVLHRTSQFELGIQSSIVLDVPSQFLLIDFDTLIPDASNGCPITNPFPEGLDRLLFDLRGDSFGDIPLLQMILVLSNTKYG